MVNFRTNNYEFFKFNPKSDEHLECINTLLNDKYVRMYLDTSSVMDFLSVASLDDEISDSAFLVGMNDSIVGYLSTFSGINFIDLQYALMSDMRGVKVNSFDSVGSLMIKEASSELFKRYEYVKFLRVYINENNIASLKMAHKVGFELVRDGFSPYELHLNR